MATGVLVVIWPGTLSAQRGDADADKFVVACAARMEGLFQGNFYVLKIGSSEAQGMFFSNLLRRWRCVEIMANAGSEGAQMRVGSKVNQGVGGCGGNAVDHMIDARLCKALEFIVINTMRRRLKRSLAKNPVQSVRRLPKVSAPVPSHRGAAAAEEDRERIKEMSAGRDWCSSLRVWVRHQDSCGPAAYRRANRSGDGHPDCGRGHQPFTYEGNRYAFRQAGIEGAARACGFLIIVPNSKLMEVLGDDVTVQQAFKAANGVLQGAVRACEVINVPGLINVDCRRAYRDVRKRHGYDGFAIAFRSRRVRVLLPERAICSPLLEDVDMSGAAPRAGEYHLIQFVEAKDWNEVMECVQFAAEEATGDRRFRVRRKLCDEMRVTVVATGLARAGSQAATPRVLIA